MRPPKIHLIILILFSSIELLGQENFRTMHWGLNEGLSQAENYNILKDYFGFIWITSKNGLNRFDGNTFKRYFATGNSKYNLIADDTRFGLKEDSLHNIWIGSEKGISRFDIRADTFTHFRQPIDSITGNQSAVPMWATKSEVICVEKDRVIVAYNIRTLQKRKLGAFSQGDKIAIGPSLAYSYFDSASNSLWTLRGESPVEKAALLEINLTTGEKNMYSWPMRQDIKMIDHNAEAMKYDDRRNAIWINTRDGLWKFSLANRKFEVPEATKNIARQKGYDRFVGIDLDQSGRVWFATQPKGILIFDPEKNTITTPFPGDSVLQNKVSFANACIYVDRDGITWIGRWLMNGIDAIQPFSRVNSWYHSFPNPQDLLHVAIVPTYVGKNRVLISGVGEALLEFDTHTGGMRMIPRKKFGTILSGSSPLFSAIGADTLASISWLKIGYGKDLFEWNLKNDSCRKIGFLDDLMRPINAHPGMTMPFRKGIFTIATVDSGTRVFLIGSDAPVGYQIIDLGKKTFEYYYLMSDGERTIFFRGSGANENMVFRKASKQWSPVKSALDNIPWTGIAFSEFDSSYWVAADRALYHFTYDLQLIGKLGKEHGIPELVVGGLRIDKNGDLWFHTDRSIHRVNTKTGFAYMLSKKDGFDEQTFETMPFTTIDGDGDIYFAGGVFGEGFNRIRVRNFSENPPVSIYFRDVRINNEELKLETGFNYLEQIQLKHDQNTIALETGIIDPYSGGTTSIRYKLEGVDSNWLYGPYYSTIRYDALPPGDYQLLIQANSSSGQFNGIQRKLGLHISPAFWQTSWFRVALVLMLIGLMYAIIQYRSRNLRKKNVELEEKVAHRTRELKHSLEDLRETQSQLIQREKMASLGELTAGIAHEIQNPLNFVNNFSEVNKELIDEMDLEIENGNLSDLKSIANNIRENELKINQHGKRADAIVKGMLQHSRASTGVKEPTDINALADEYLRLSYHGLRAKDKSFNADFDTRFDPDLREINIIPQDIGRVLLNIYNNAFYAVHEKQKQLGDSFKPFVSVTTQFISATKGTTPQVEIRIRDNGMGIPQKVLAKIFQPFFTTKPTGEGTGLGLSLSYDIVTKVHNGELLVNTVEGEFTEFIIRLLI